MAAKTGSTKKTTKVEATAKDKRTSQQGLPNKLERHPLSERYGPKMSTEELQGLADDIKAHGLHEPIILYEGKVLAGWNRYQACLLAGIDSQFRDMAATSDPVAVAFGTNFVRRKLGSVQKAFFGAQFCAETGAKQADIAKTLACNLNRLNQCCQLLKRDDKEAQALVEQLRDSAEMSSTVFDEAMQELGIAKEPKPTPPRPARAADPLIDSDDDVDFEDDDVTGGAIDALGEDPTDDDPSPSPATRKKKGSKPGEEVGDDEPLPAVGTSRTSMTNPHETPVSRAAKHFKALSPDDQRKFVKFAWGKLKAALDAALSHGDVEYELPGVKPDPSLIARSKPTGKLDDGHVAAPKKGKAAPAKGNGKAAPAKGNGKAAPAKAKAKGKAAPAKAAKPAKARGKDADI